MFRFGVSSFRKETNKERATLELFLPIEFIHPDNGEKSFPTTHWRGLFNDGLDMILVECTQINIDPHGLMQYIADKIEELSKSGLIPRDEIVLWGRPYDDVPFYKEYYSKTIPMLHPIFFFTEGEKSYCILGILVSYNKSLSLTEIREAIIALQESFNNKPVIFPVDIDSFDIDS